MVKKNTRIASTMLAICTAAAIALPVSADDSNDPFYQAKGDHRRTYAVDDEGKERPYRVYVPSTWDKSKHLPMVVVLHGGGLDENAPFDRGPENLKGILVAQAEKHGFIVVAPNGGDITPQVGYGGGMYPKPDSATSATAPPRPIGAAGSNVGAPPAPIRLTPEQAVRENALSEKDVMNVVERTAAEYNVDRSRIYLMGNSMGEIGTLYLAQKYAGKWCAIAPSDGPIEPTAYEYERIKGLSGAFFVQGENDAGGVGPNRAISTGFRKQGVDTRFEVVPGGDHPNSWYMELAEIFDFFDVHRCAK